MDVFAVHDQMIADYRRFTEGGTVIRDDRIKSFVEDDLDSKAQWPEPWLSLSPSFAPGGNVVELVRDGVLHPSVPGSFRRRSVTTARSATAGRWRSTGISGRR